MKRSERIEWFLRIATFGSALAVGIIGAWSIWFGLVLDKTLPQPPVNREFERRHD